MAVLAYVSDGANRAVRGDLENAYRSYYATGAAGVDIEIKPGTAFRPVSVRVHLDAASAAENFIVGVDSRLGTGYDSVLSTTAMSGKTDLVVNFEEQDVLFTGDQLKVDYANSGTNTYGVEIVIELL